MRWKELTTILSDAVMFTFQQEDELFLFSHGDTEVAVLGAPIGSL